MKSKLPLVVIFLAICNSAYSEELFSECKSVLNQPDYKKLQEYLSSTKANYNFCQRLNNHEFLFTDDRNFYYCHLSNGQSLTCEEHQKSYWFPSPTVAKRFSGANGKKFVLFRTSRLSRGVYSEGYQVFYFVPKAINESGYVILALSGAGVTNGAFSDGGQICSNMSSSEASAPVGNGFEILNEHKNNVSIRFSTDVTSCATSKKLKQTLEFTWQNGAFVQTTNNRQ